MSYRRSKRNSKDAAYQFEWFGNNRHLCDVLEDMRKCAETSNFSMMKGLIEEAQVMGNRMEAGLNDQKDLLKLQKELSKARKEYKKLEKEYNALSSKVRELKPSEPPKSQE